MALLERAADQLCRAPALPRARGPWSEAVLDHLRFGGRLRLPSSRGLDVLEDHDFQLALYCCYELHYRGFAGVRDDLEWSPEVLEARAGLERAFLDRVRDEVGPLVVGDAVDAVSALVSGDGGPSLSRYMAERGTLEQLREFCIHRSAYQLKEADPHTWAIPRLAGEAKAAMIEIQADEYGGGVERAMHSSLFAQTMLAVGLDPTYGRYLDLLPASTLATVNLVSMFGLHRRWRGALVGHLAIFEMTSVTPMQRYADALRRLGFGPDAREFYDVHVAADAVHEVIALERMVAGFVAAEPERAGDVVFGAAAVMAVEARFARHLLDAWSGDGTSLLGR